MESIKRKDIHALKNIMKTVLRIEAKIRNNLKIWRAKKLYKASKNEEGVSIRKNILLQSMISIIVFSLMLNGIIPALFSESKLIIIIFTLSLILLYLSFYSIILFKDKKDLQKEFRVAVKFSIYTYTIGAIYGISLY